MKCSKALLKGHLIFIGQKEIKHQITGIYDIDNYKDEIVNFLYKYITNNGSDFVAKICALCGTKIGILSGKIQISNGCVCQSCLNSAGIGNLDNSYTYNTATLKNLIEKRKQEISGYFPTKKICDSFSVDENKKQFNVGRNIFDYSNLLNYELIEDGESVTKGGVGRAVAGGLLFGGVGAIVGGITGKKKTKGVCNSMKIRITLKNSFTDTVYISLIIFDTKTDSLNYRIAQSTAQSCISALEIILDEVKSKSVSGAAIQNSPADEIIKYKQLLDAGAITQEEFEAKKKQLLNL